MKPGPPGDEVDPPWVEYPGFPPADGFWRQSGEAWLNHVWRPYFDALTADEQASYLERWKVPDDWRLFYFDPEFQKWLESTDEE